MCMENKIKKDKESKTELVVVFALAPICAKKRLCKNAIY